MDPLSEALELVLVAHLQVLPPLERAVLVLRDLQGLSPHDTAAALGCSGARVAALHRRARCALAASLAQREALEGWNGEVGTAST